MSDSAFPHSYSISQSHMMNGDTVRHGLTKRELFAALAMQGYCSTAPGDWPPIADIADDCVRMADALIAELSKPSGEKE